jgi:hypothetical protein
MATDLRLRDCVQAGAWRPQRDLGPLDGGPTVGAFVVFDESRA